MDVLHRRAAFIVRAVFSGLIAALVAVVPALAATAAAQADPAAPEARVIVTGEGSVSVPPDLARVRGGVTTRAKSAKEAADANAKLMTAVTAALVNAGIEQKDIQTARFSVQPVYTAPAPNTEQKLTGFSVSNQVTVTIRQIAKAGEILDRLIESGATDVGAIEFLHADPSKALDRAREAAVADARRKAEVYTQAAGEKLGAVAWITEEPGYVPPGPMKALRAASMPAPTPIATGEDVLRVQITVGFDLAR